MNAFQVSPQTEKAQTLAADPRLSVFVAANAGSGKTHVLTERVVRLLLAGAEPSRILCLTYTKAAAAEMQNRVFDRLSRWAVADEAALAEEIGRLEGRKAGPERLARARRLFAEALETPGGLKIQTIHAFCEAILHQFPLEANVPGHFEVLDDAESALLLAEARRLLIEQSRPEEDPALSDAFATALELAGEWGLDQLLKEIVRKRDAIRSYVDDAGGVEAAIARLQAALELEDGACEDSIHTAAIPFPGFDDAFCQRLLEAARLSDKKTDQTLCIRLSALLDAADAKLRFEALCVLCLKKTDGKLYKLSGFCTQTVSRAFDDLEERLTQAGAHIETVRDRLASYYLFRASAAALVLADRLEEDYARLKRQRSRLDFEDLVVRTADLLSRGEAGQWVHYKLDQGIDHVLIDEAQDTSPRQWQVVRSLVEEFFAGRSARGGTRTVFAVGDEKQSIYSFQGASPAMFAEERRALGRRADETGLRFANVSLHQSFRSARDVLEAVDHVFSVEDNRRGLSSEAGPPVHSSARREGERGTVEIWPAIQAARTEESADWLQPIDVEPGDSPSNRLAARIAERVEAWLGQEIVVKGKPRAITPGDVLVLVRKRTGFVQAMASALRKAGIAVAGADRLVITDHIAVQDLMALGRAVANTDDELSLATVLKSPFFGFSDDDLMALALSRADSGPLYLALRRIAGPEGAWRLPDFVEPGARAALHAKASVAFTRLETLRNRAGFETVFAFYARILGPEGGRARLVARLGHDAGEVVDAFLDLALAEEQAGETSLDAFLANLAAAPPEIKREMEHGRQEVRIMTVHSSKGLEAPIVFLVDPGSAPFSHSHGSRLMLWDGMPGLVPGQAPALLWRADKSCENACCAALKAREKALAEEEYRRLLYVGMTRAADRLVVCGTAGLRGPHEECWLRLVQAAMTAQCEELPGPDGAPAGWRFGPVPDEKPAIAYAEDDAETQGRPVDLTPLAREPLPPRPITPSSAGGNRIEPDETSVTAAEGGRASPVLGTAGRPSAAIRRGLTVHKLLQVLPTIPRQEREAATERYMATACGDIPPEDCRTIISEVFRVMDDPSFAPLFSAGSRAEVSVAGTLDFAGEAHPVSGTIDRLAVTDEAVLLVDYKTDRIVPDDEAQVPPGTVLQLALYRELLKPLYPDRPIRAALLFTEAPKLIALSEEVMDAALGQREARMETHRQTMLERRSA